MTEIALFLTFLFALVQSYRHGVENQKRQDCHTDLSQLLHDGTIDKSDLRRTTDHDELQRWFDD